MLICGSYIRFNISISTIHLTHHLLLLLLLFVTSSPLSDSPMSLKKGRKISLSNRRKKGRYLETCVIEQIRSDYAVSLQDGGDGDFRR